MNDHKIRDQETHWEFKCGDREPLFGSLQICADCEKKRKGGEPLPADCPNIIVIDLQIKH